MRINVARSVPIVRSARVAQLEGLFDVAPSDQSVESWAVELDLDARPWNVGAIVGPSGSGKSTIARELFGGALCEGFEWPPDAAIVDAFPAAMGIKDITGILSSVGFSSPPFWLRPYRVLSTGQQMRVTLARLIAEQPELAVMDEFTSVVDRTVAQIGSSAIAKTVRRRGQKFVAITCHQDVIDWLQPDWTFEPHSGVFAWRELQQRPAMEFEVFRVHHKTWELFKAHHYMSAALLKSAACYCAFYRGEPIAFAGIIHQPNAHVFGLWRISRIVVLPDWQGVGVARAMMDALGEMYRAERKRLTIVTALQSMNLSLARAPHWVCRRKPELAKRRGSTSSTTHQPATGRLTASWEFVP